jgi:hypothetical protein
MEDMFLKIQQFFRRFIQVMIFRAILKQTVRQNKQTKRRESAETNRDDVPDRALSQYAAHKIQA